MFKARKAGTVLAVVVVAFALLAACSCGGDDDDDTGSSSCEYRSSAMTATASDGSSLEVRGDGRLCLRTLRHGQRYLLAPPPGIHIRGLSGATG